MKVLVMILAGGAAPGLYALTTSRAEAAAPFGGKYRIIDFPLSNCVNSGLYNIAILTQYMPRSLNEHIRAGKPWDLDRSEGGLRLLQPYQSSAEAQGAWQEGSADAIRFNIDVVRESGAEQVLLLAGNHIYKMNYEPMLAAHSMRKADVTVGVLPVHPHLTGRYGMVSADTDGRITRFEEKPRRTRSTLASMGIYVFEASVLMDALSGSISQIRHIGGDLMPRLVRRKKVYSYEFEGYWANVSTIPAYYEANMGLLADIPALDLNDPRWVIHTRSEQRPPVLLGEAAHVSGNLLCDGAVVEGEVHHSIIGPGVSVAAGAVVRDSIIMNDTHIAAGAVIDRSIIDKEVQIGEGACIGWGDDNTPNEHAPGILNTGITLVGKRSEIPAGVRLGRNVLVGAGVGPEDFASEEVASGHRV
ncbi:MAG: glucose-1-phosphate adenylyltransferase [Caldilineales bacterium]|nr:glucose-1-phosphate adenylyltransferase [Caldilineales bacterium]